MYGTRMKQRCRETEGNEKHGRKGKIKYKKQRHQPRQTQKYVTKES
jgi:hypothetical protein